MFLLLLKCYLPAECLLLLHALIFHLCLFLPAQLDFFWHSEHAFAYLLNKISDELFSKVNGHVNQQTVTHSTCWEVPV